METTRHELQHLIQTFLEYTAKEGEQTKLRGGVAKEVSDKNYDALGNSLQGKSPQEHDLRDIEYMPELSDSISKFQLLSSRVPLALKNAFARVWVGLQDQHWFKRELRQYLDISKQKTTMEQMDAVDKALSTAVKPNSFFLQLKLAQPAKYERAVRDFWKKVQP